MWNGGGRGVVMADEGGEKGCHANGRTGHICDVDAAIASVSFNKNPQSHRDTPALVVC